MLFPQTQQVLEVYQKRFDEEDAIIKGLTDAEIMSRLDEFLLAIGPNTAAVLHSLIIARKSRVILELGTSYGYSTLYLADAAKKVGGRVVTMDIAAHKQDYAREMLEKAGLADVVDFRLGDAVEMIGKEAGPFDFVLLDIWKDLYVPCLHAFHPKLADEAIIAADNIIYPPMFRDTAREYRAAVAAYPDLQSVLLSIGSGMEISCKWVEGSPKL